MQSTIKELLEAAEKEGLKSIAHIVNNGQHEYNLTLNSLKKMDENKVVEVLSLGRSSLTMSDFFGHVRSRGKSKLYRVSF